jgi:flagellar FliJ protein
MRKFSFRLEPVLDYREIREDLAQRRLADAMREAARVEEVLAGLRQRRERLIEEMAMSQDGAVNLVQVQQCVDYLGYLLACIDRTRAELAEMVAHVEQRRRELVEATRDKKVLERVKERDFAEYVREAQALEQKFLDEVATIRHARSMRADGAGRAT